jgi:hypothetical protein
LENDQVDPIGPKPVNTQIVEVSVEEVESYPYTNSSELKEFYQHLPFLKLLTTMNNNKIRLEVR